MNLLIHVEDSRFVGILPSQLDSIRLLARAQGFERLAFVDKTLDGVERYSEWERFGTLSAWMDGVDGPIVVFAPGRGSDFRQGNISEESWLVFGPAQGFDGGDFRDREVQWVSIPVDADLNSRDAVSIALWELGG